MVSKIWFWKKSRLKKFSHEKKVSVLVSKKVSVLVSKIFGLKTSLGNGLEKDLVSKKSLGIGLKSFGLKKVSVSVSDEISGLVTQWF